MIGYGQAIILGLLQGFSELFPISSLGHSVILPGLLGWDIHQNDDFFITFLVATHLATAIVLLAFFWRDWVRIVRGLGRSLRDRRIDHDDPDAVLGWLLIVGTIPAGVIGLLLEHPLRSLFASPTSAAIFLMVNGLLLFGAERLRKRAPLHEEGDPDGRIAGRLTWRSAIGVGTVQALALIPGISRSGVTMGGGLLAGLSNEDAARYAFLLATPIRGPGRRRARAGVRGRALRGSHRLPVRAVPDALLRDAATDALRLVLPERRRRRHGVPRGDLSGGMRSPGRGRSRSVDSFT